MKTYPRIERMKVADLIDQRYPQNPHVATPEAMAQLNDQIDALGNVQPITFNVRTQRILSGNKKIELYHQRGDKLTEVWCVDLPEAKEQITVIALNNHAGDFDPDNLKLLTETIANSTEDGLDLTGFKPGELARLVAQADVSFDKSYGKSDGKPAQKKPTTVTCEKCGAEINL